MSAPSDHAFVPRAQARPHNSLGSGVSSHSAPASREASINAPCNPCVESFGNAAPGGPRVTEESRPGFPALARRASLGNAPRDHCPPIAHRAVRARGGRADRRPDARRAAGRDDPLDRPRDGQGGGRQPLLRAARLALARASAAPHPHLQALERPAVRRQGARHRRALRRSARPMRWSCRSTRRARSRRSTARSRACP